MALQLNYETPDRLREPRWLAASCLLIAASLLALAVNVRDGEYWPTALRLLALAIPFCILGTLCGFVRDRGWGATVVTVCTLGAIAAQLFAYEFSPPGGWNTWSDDLSRRTVPGLALYYGGAWVAWLLVALSMLFKRGRAIVIAFVIVIHFCVGVWFIRAAPSPRIDVFEFQQQAARALLEGRNPYDDVAFHDIYDSTSPGARPVYGPDLSRQGRLAFGFPYPPLSLYLSTAGYALAGDHRYAQLVAMSLAGLLIALMRPADSLSVVVATLFLFMPRGFFILGRGWTEPFVVLFLVATVFCALRCRRLLPVAFGLLLASKQYTVLIVPVAALLVEGPVRWRAYLVLMAKAVGVAALVTLPFALWDFRAFWHSLVTVQNLAPFREDALSLLVWIYHKTGVQLGVAPAFAVAAVTITVALWRAQRTPAGFAASVGTVYLLFVALNKQAFANYYYFVIAALWCGLAAIPKTTLQPEADNVR